ncbi:MAG: UDP-N-acetylmuramoyl-L-alanine--D-glutamate ligase [Clostridia bacterium]|nr:UDP-N-acetylmuramoyl-L-alanine--D-glutamate ligase [Clostridia bacterium]
MDFANKKVLIYGAGISGKSAYKFLANKCAEVYLFSDKKLQNENEFNVLDSFSKVMQIKFDYVVLSPGVSIIGNKNITKLKKTGALILSELELGYLFCRGKFVAITGTNGKTTCVSLLHHALKDKYDTFLCGNIGTPITSICEQTTDESVIVCEVSSFMLETVSPNFKPFISAILNITPDHISRHKTFDEYYKTKLKITNFQNEQDYLLLPANLWNIDTLAKKLVVVGKKYKSNLIGEFNDLNIAFCEKICELLNISKKEFASKLKTFSPVEFRLQYLGKKRGVTYINDSKSTNPDSTVCAIKAIKKPVIVLLGGSDKGNNFNQIFELKNKIKLAIIYGQTADILENDALFCGFKNISKFNNLKEALNYLKIFTKRRDIVLFSPACASYDEFNNYVERGKYFNNYFKNI